MLYHGNQVQLLTGQLILRKASMLLVVQLANLVQYGGGAAVSGPPLCLKL